MSIRKALKRVLGRGLARAVPASLMLEAGAFETWERRGVHVLPANYYSPIPQAPQRSQDALAKTLGWNGIEIREADQLRLLAGLAADFQAEFDALARTKPSTPHEYYATNGNFGSVDAEILYGLIRRFKPRRVFEIGSGFSTYLAAEALLRNRAESGTDFELRAIEPYPNPVLRAGFPGLTRLVAQRVQDVPLSEFGALAANDVLFIDSTHVLTTGGDVQYEFGQVIPSLAPGVLVHVHDIFLPADYPMTWLRDNRWFWNEQYLLHAFLQFNSAFEVLWAGSWMHLSHSPALAAVFKSYDPRSVHPASFWMRRRDA